MRYKLKKEQMEAIIPIIRRLEGASILLATLSENVGRDKFELWETIYGIYPELKGKAAAINEHKSEIVVQEQSQLVTPVGANLIPKPGRN